MKGGDRIATAKAEETSLVSQIEAARKTARDAELAGLSEGVPASTIKLTRVNELSGHSGKIYSICWAGEGQSTKILSASQDGKLVLWDAATKHKLKAVSLVSTWVMSCGLSPTTSFAASGGLENICSIFNLRTEELAIKKPAQELAGHTGYISSCVFVEDSEIITSSGDGTCASWDVETQARKGEFIGHKGGVSFAALPSSADKSRFATASCDTTIKIWDRRTTAPVITFRGHTKDANSVTFFPDGNAVASASDDGTCRLFDIRSQNALMVYGHDDISATATSVSFSHSGRFLFAGYGDGSCKIWDTFRGTVCADMQYHDKSLHCLSVSSDGFALATSGWDCKIAIYSI